MARRSRPPVDLDLDLAELPEVLRWREWAARAEVSHPPGLCGRDPCRDRHARRCRPAQAQNIILPLA